MRLIPTTLAATLAVSLLPASWGRSERGFQLVPQVYVVASPRFDGPGLSAAATPATPAEGAVGGEHGAAPQTPAYSTTVQAQDTPWVRVHFSDFHLGAGSYLMLTSVLDGQSQRLDMQSLPIWQNASAIFNGGTVQVELFTAPGDTGVYFAIDSLLVADHEDFAVDFEAVPVPVIEATLCDDNDDRTLSTDSRVGRLFFGGCTGWLVHNGAALTAGHCGTPDGNITGVMEFNVPLSSPDGMPFAAPVNDQYPVMSVQASEADGEGEDFAVFTVGTNSNTGLRPHIAQGFYHMTSAVPSEGAGLRVTGYGVDATPAGPGGVGAACCDIDDDDVCDFTCNARNLVQQTDTGSCDDCLAGTAIEHTVDTMPANSGSPIIWNSTGATIAIHTHGGCDTILSDFDNAGTWLGYSPLRTALQNYLPNRVWVDAVSAQPIRTGSVLAAFRNMSEVAVSAPTGSTLAIVAGNYTAVAGNAVTLNRAMTLTAPMGLVRIGD